MAYLFTQGELGRVQGENFNPKTYLSCDSVGVITQNIIDNNISFAKNSCHVLLTRGLMNQKYRIIKVLSYANVVGDRA